MENLLHTETLAVAQERLQQLREAAQRQIIVLSPAQHYLDEIRARLHPELLTDQE